MYSFSSFFLYFCIMKTQKLIYCLCFLFLVPLTIQGQNFFVRNFSTEEYRAGTQNWQSALDSKQCLYFANNHGMLIFDGSKWETHQVKNYTAVRCLNVDEANNRIYVGATGEFGYFYFNPVSCETEYLSLSDMLPEKEKNFTDVWRVHVWNGKIAFQSYQAIYIFDNDKYVSTMHSQNRIEISAVVGNDLVVASRKELTVFNPNHTRKVIPLVETLGGSVTKEIIALGNNILLCTPEKGFFLVDGDDVSHFSTSIDANLRDDKLFSATMHDNILAVGTVRNGVYLYNINNHTYSHVNVNSGLANNTVLSLSFTSAEELWLCLDNGISLLRQHSAFQQIIPFGHSIGTGCASLFYNGKLFLGTNQGLFVTENPIDLPSPSIPQSINDIKGQVWTLCEDDGRLLCGADDGAYQIRGDRAEIIANTDGTWKICQLKNHPGYLIASDYNGLYILHYVGGRYVVHARLENCNIVSNSIIEDLDGSIWVCHWQDGIYHITLNDDLTRTTAVTRFHKGNGLLVDQGNNIAVINGIVVISSVDGIHTYNKQTKKLEKSQSLTELFNTYDTSMMMHQTPDGNIWGVKQGFMAIAHHPNSGDQFADYKVDRTSFQSIVRKIRIGLGDITSINSRYTLFSGQEGYYIIDNNYENVNETSNVYIRNIISINSTDSLLYSFHVKAEKQEILIPHQNNSLRIEFVMPEYRSTEGVVYSCYLENYDNEWSVEQTACYKEYTHLSKGKYCFHVRARNLINGIEKEDLIEFEVKAAWYESTLAYIIYIILIAAALYGINLLVRRRNQKALEHEREKQQQQMMEIKSQNLEMELKLKSHELASSTMNLVRKNDILQEIDEEMSKLSESVRREEPKADITHRISNIRKGLKKSINNDDNWDKFEESFDLIYDNMMQRLCKEFPELKMSDRRLCAYLRMGLNSKEIASLTNSTTRSIETARYRLRKKLNLASGDNLSDFLLNY